MDYDALQLALKTWVLVLLGWTAPTDPVVFENEPRPQPGAGRIAILSWVSGTGVGLGENRFEDTGAAAPAADLVPVTVRDELLVLQIGVEVTDQRAATNARQSLATLLGRAHRPSSLAALKAANVGLAGTGTVTQADYRADGRWWSRCVLEVRLNASFFERDATGAVSSIASVQVTSHVSGTDGVLLPAGEQMNNVTIP